MIKQDVALLRPCTHKKHFLQNDDLIIDNNVEYPIVYISRNI